MAKQKRKKSFSRLSSFFLMLVFVFSSVFILSGCSTPDFYVGVIYKQLGTNYVINQMSGPILRNLFAEYGMANEHTVKVKNANGQETDVIVNNWGDVNFSHLLGKTGSPYNTEKTKEIANETSEFTHFYYIKVKHVQNEPQNGQYSQFILICSTRALSSVELGNGSNSGDGAGMIVGYDSNADKYYLRWRQEQNFPLTENRYATGGITRQNLSTGSSISMDQGVAHTQITSNQAYKYTHKKIGGDTFDDFNAYIFVGSNVGGQNIGSPVAFMNNFYHNNHVNAMQRDLRGLSAPQGEASLYNPQGEAGSSWKHLSPAISSWATALTENELSNQKTYSKRESFFAYKYEEYLALAIVRTIFEFNDSRSGTNLWSGTLFSKYNEALNVVLDLVYTDTHTEYKEAATNKTAAFIQYVTSNFNINLSVIVNAQSFEYAIFDRVINNSDIIYRSNFTVTEIAAGIFFKNYVQQVQSIVASYDTSTQQSLGEDLPASTKGYYLDSASEGFNNILTCSLNAVFFANRTKKEKYSSLNASFPSFTVVFDADENNLAKLKTYKFMLYYHNYYAQVMGDPSKHDYCVEVNPNEEDLNDGFFDVNVYAEYNNHLKGYKEKREYMNLTGTTLFDGIYGNALSNGNTDRVGNVAGKKFLRSDGFTTPFVSYMDYGAQDGHTTFDFIELILLPRSTEEIAIITILDIWI